MRKFATVEIGGQIFSCHDANHAAAIAGLLAQCQRVGTHYKSNWSVNCQYVKDDPVSVSVSFQNLAETEREAGEIVDELENPSASSVAEKEPLLFPEDETPAQAMAEQMAQNAEAPYDPAEDAAEEEATLPF